MQQGRDLEQAVELVHRLAREHPDRFRRFMAELRELSPQVDEISTKMVDGGAE